MNNKAIVTLTLGGRHQYAWKHYCESTWRAYAERFGYDILLLEKPLDVTERAAKRSAAWQKCLVLSQPWSAQYERVVWVDADIVMNTDRSSSIVENVPVEKVGAVNAFTTPSPIQFQEANARNSEYYIRRGSPIVHENTIREFYENWGLPRPPVDEVVQSGVMVLSPQHHRELLERVYYQYEDAGPGGMYEMRALSYEFLKADCVQWLDPRFNSLWMMDKLLHYPFLFHEGRDKRLSARARRRVGRELGIYSIDWLKRACQTSSWLNSFFLHYAGAFDDIGHVDLTCQRWDRVRVAATDGA